jgi:N-acetylglucosaminyldiphosphoundecaprenol N-acetyl-beta-D-mannosaminyltransferase
LLRILGTRLDSLTRSETLQRIRQLLDKPGSHHVVTGNTLMLLDAEKDADLRDVLEKAALVVPESSGVYWASRRLGAPLQEFFPGIDLLCALCEMAGRLGKSVYLLGAKPEVATKAAMTLTSRFPGLEIAGTRDGYFSADATGAVLEAIRQRHPDFLFVARSVPEQEKWIASHLRETGASIVMGVGGSFDVLSGTLKRAPEWMRRAGIEWLYRLAQEPWRWRRIVRLPLFAWKILKQ